MNPADPKTDHLFTQLAGGGWQPEDWSPDDKKILLVEGISVNEAYVWLVDAATGEKTSLTPRKTDEQVAYSNPRFSKDGKGMVAAGKNDPRVPVSESDQIDAASKNRELRCGI
jgi:Tol biopolymer transport system component